MEAALLCSEEMTSRKGTTVFVLVVAVASQPYPGGSAISAKGGAICVSPEEEQWAWDTQLDNE